LSSNAKKAFRGITPSHEAGAQIRGTPLFLFGLAGIVAGMAVCHLVRRDLAIEGSAFAGTDKATTVPDGNLSDLGVLLRRSAECVPKIYAHSHEWLLFKHLGRDGNGRRV
jgi:hypothetical protein